MTGAEIDLPHWLGSIPPADAARRLVDELDGWARSDALADLATGWGGRPPDVELPELLVWFDEFSGAHWDFRRGAERNLVQAPALSDAQSAIALDSARRLGLATSRPPKRDRYDHIIVLGGLIRACLVRPRYAARLIADGLGVGSVTALGGFRMLQGDEMELAARFAPGAQDEFEAMVSGMMTAFNIEIEPAYDRPIGQRKHGDWNMAHLSHAIPLSVIAAPSAEPSKRRANSPDTYAWWASRHGDLHCRTLLLITTDIYVPYQGAGATQILGIDYGADVETVGVPAALSALGTSTQAFAPHNYLQEVRSAIRGYRALYDRVAGMASASAG